MKKFQNNLTVILALFATAFSSCAQVELPQTSRTLNSEVLSAIKSMPSGGGYEASQAAVDRLAASVTLKDGTIRQDTKAAGKSFCSGATYLVLLRVIERLRLQNSSFLPADKLTRFAHLGVKDGEEVFGRWNANGPGAAKLFADLECGVNFTSFDHARPGDFLKLWWTDAIGGKERGHLVIYLGHNEHEVRFWSSNQPDGYGEKTVTRNKIKHHLFSRLTTPQNLVNATRLSKTDPFLADMLHHNFTWTQIVKSCKVKTTP